MIKINGIEFDFDAYDAEDMEKAKGEMNKVVYQLEHAPKNLDRIEAIKYTVKVVSECFNNLFGDDSANKIFKGKTTMKLALKAFEQLTAGIQEQDIAFEKEIKETTKKYSPNRAAARKNIKHKK